MGIAGFRVAIVTHRFECLGGIQTCFMELIEGLNRIGIVPEVVWDEETNWSALGNPGVQATFGGGELAISSGRLRSLPSWLSSRLAPLSVHAARLELGRYDFVYSFESAVRMPPGKPNLCWAIGPPFVRMPEESVNWRKILSLGELRKLTRMLTTPAVRPDSNSEYVTHSEWIADLIEEHHGFRPPVIWPPVRSRCLPPAPSNRSGFLFLSRLQEYKRAESMLAIAREYPEEKVAISGVVLPSNDPYVAHLQRIIKRENLSNVEIIENPSEEKVGKLLTSHVYFVFPAHWEHFGIVTVEAIQAGLLPLVHDSGGQREIVPIDSLRFNSDQELIACAGQALRLTNGQRQTLVDKLRRHVERGSAKCFREAMLQPLKRAYEKCIREQPSI